MTTERAEPLTVEEEELADRSAAEFEPNIDIRDLVIAWFHDSEEICEHDEPPPACEIMADHLLAAFKVELRDWKAYVAYNRRSPAARAVRGEPEPTPPPPLDVERLARAIDAMWPKAGVVSIKSRRFDWMAQRIAAEYTRLAEPSATPSPDAGEEKAR